MKHQITTRMSPEETAIYLENMQSRNQVGQEVKAALERLLPPEKIAELIESLPAASRARLEKQFGPLPKSKNPSS